MKRLLFFILPIIIFGFSQQQNNDDIVVWAKERKLTWNDFQGTIPYRGFGTAVSSCSIYTIYNLRNDYTLKIGSYSYLRKSKSWKREEAVSNDYGLNHEQRHFDIAEIHSRIFKKKLVNYNYKSINESNVYFDKLLKKVDYFLERMNEQYDYETNHSQIRSAQLRWDKKIDSMLVSLDAYSKQEFIIDLNYLRKQ